MEIILASKSPRRKELLSTIVNDFKIIESTFDESSIKINNPKKLVKALAQGKCEKVFNETTGVRCVIGADSIVVVNNKVLGKPKTEEKAKEMLRLISGTKHQVLTGMCIKYTFDNELVSQLSFVCSSTVYFKKLDEKEIEEYVNSKEPLDKAGAYAIQGLAGKFVEKINGSFHNIVGLPVAQLYSVLKQENII
ncbi:MAG: septum formation inhibitor Maf [Clostridia bacterium]|nr:septum formation inhibitor Maf [Clostridia bacterium]